MLLLVLVLAILVVVNVDVDEDNDKDKDGKGCWDVDAMGLLSIIRKNKLKEKELRVLFVGLDNSGKTTIVKRINGEAIDDIAPTLGFNIKTFVHRGFTLNVWDIGGQRSLRPYWRNYFERTDAVVWVVDSCDSARMADCHHELWSLLGEERLAGATVLIFANKQDIPGAMTSDEVRRHLELDKITTHAWRIQPCSAVTGLNLLTGLDWLVNDVASRIYHHGASHAAPTVAPDTRRRTELAQ